MIPRAIIINQLNEFNLPDGVNLKMEIAAKIRMDEASAWVKKYLMEASDVDGVGLRIRRGTKDIKLISKANHVINQDDEDDARIVLNTKIKSRIKLYSFMNI